MKLRDTLMVTFLGLLALPAMAQEAAIDVNGDSNYSFPELQVALPEMTLEEFTVLDANGDGLLDSEEIATAIEAELLPAPGEG